MQPPIDIRSIRDMPKTLPLMKDGRLLARQVQAPFLRAVVATSRVLELPRRSPNEPRVLWFTPANAPGKVFFALTPMRMHDRTEGVYLDHIYAPQQGQGHGGRCLATLCALADFHNATICLNAEPEGEKPLAGTQLQGWYERHGFVFAESIGAKEQRGAVRKPAPRARK